MVKKKTVMIGTPDSYELRVVVTQCGQPGDFGYNQLRAATECLTCKQKKEKGQVGEVVNG